MSVAQSQALMPESRKFRCVLMKRKRAFRLTPIPKIRVKIGTDKKGYVHCLFGSYGKIVNPNEYDESGVYIKGQPWNCWISATLHAPGCSDKTNKQLMYDFWNYVRMNIKNIHPADLANLPTKPAK